MTKMINILFFSLLVGCSNPIATVAPPEPVSKEQMLQAHRKLALDEKIEIEAFVSRKGWTDMERTESGLYMLQRKDTVHTTDLPLKYGDTAELRLNVKLLNGVEIFDGTQRIITGRTEMAAGLREALLKMKYGESAYLIVPSHLAYGFSGDGDNIPSHATLLYELRIINK
jgi:FKBP-type peptidyl-prolyl cis-trans isomerase